MARIVLDDEYAFFSTLIRSELISSRIFAPTFSAIAGTWFGGTLDTFATASKHSGTNAG